MSDSNTSSAIPESPKDVDGATSQEDSGLKRSRRQAAFYPMQTKPNKPFSKSAIKRESVMALGSIEHLQHYFTKNGLATKRQSRLTKGLVPALGPSVIPTLEVSTPSSTRLSFELPPPPAVASSPRPHYPHVERERVASQVDPEVLKPVLIRELEETERVWSTPPSPETNPGPALLTAANVNKSSAEFFEVLPALQITTRTIRCVRNYLVSLPDDAITEARPPPAPPKSAPQRSNLLGSVLRRPLPPARVKASAVPFPSATRENDPFTKIRKAALDVLAMLRELEESSRIPLSDDAYDSLSVGSGSADLLSMSEDYLLSPVSRSHTPPNTTGSGSSTTDRGRAGSVFSGDEDDNDSMTSASISATATTIGGPAGSATKPLKPPVGAIITTVPVKGANTLVQVWADEEEPFDINADSPRQREAWDQRLVLGGGWLYKQVPTYSLADQRAMVEKYLGVVDEILFGGPNGTGFGLGSKVINPVERSPTMSPSTEGPSSPAAPDETRCYRRGWLRVKASLPTSSRLRRGRSSLGPHSPTTSEASAPSASLRRVASAGLLGPVADLVAEPDDIRGRGFAHGDDRRNGDAPMSLGDLMEGDEEEEEEDQGEFEDDELPEWARRDRFILSPLARVHAMLAAYLPAHLVSHLPPFSTSPSDRIALLVRLSDGQLLCVGYNTVVRRSRKQWGFIGADSIHDIIDLEERRRAEEEEERKKGTEVKPAGVGARTGWTFRRTENLRLWAAALKLRYLVALAPPSATPAHLILPPSPILPNPTAGSHFLRNSTHTPHTPLQAVLQAQTNQLASPSKTLLAMGPPSLFDPRMIAKREGGDEGEEGWASMLEGALHKWMDRVLRETREKSGGVGV